METTDTSDVRERSADPLDLLLQLSPDPLLVTDRDGWILRVNGLAEALLGYRENELVGRLVEALIPESRRGRHVTSRHAYAAAPRARAMGSGLELQARHKDGSEIPVEISLAPRQIGNQTVVCCGIRDLRERKRAEQLLRAIMQGTAAETGTAFMCALVRNLARALEVRYAFVAEFASAARERAQVLAMWDGGDFAQPFEYPLAGTPCAVVDANSECLVSDRVRQAFPEDASLQRLGVESYFGMLLHARDGDAIGLLCIMDVKPLGNEDTARTVLRIFASRAGAELEGLRALSALREGHAQLRLVADNMPAMVAYHDAQTRYRYVNRRFTEFHGITQDKVLGKTLAEFLGPENWQKVQPRMQAALGGEEIGYHRAHRLADGSERDLEISLVPHRDDSGGVIGVYALMADVTERWRAEQALRASEAQLRLIADNVPAMIAYYDSQAHYRYANRRYADFFGVAPEKLRAMTLAELVGPEYWETIRPQFEAALGGTSVSYERRYRLADGKERDLGVSFVPHRDESGSVIGVYGLISDISERKLAEEALRASEARFRSLSSLSSDYYWETDAGHRFTLRTEIRGITFALGPDAWRGRTRWDMPSVSPDAAGWRAHRAVLERHEPFRDFEFARRAADGSVRHYSISGEPMFAADGRFTGYRGVGREISRQKQAEEALRASEAQLRLIADNAPAMIAYCDRDWRYRYANRAYTDFYAPGTPSLEGRKVAEVLGAETWQAVRERAARALAGETLNFRRRDRRTDGRKRDVEVTLVPHRDDSGQVLGVYAMVLDVTERRRAERALRLRERAIESSVNAVMITEGVEDDYALVYVNPAFERVTGYAAGEVMGRNPRFLHREDREQAGLRELRAAVREEREGNALLRNYRKDGTMFWSELRVAPVRDDKGRATHYVGVSSDVTDRVRDQEQLERQANYDTLTGLPNRNLLRDRLEQALVQARRGRQRAAALYIDLDDLKRINDSLGHPTGDKVITAIGSRIAGVLRSGDTVARMSGDEFVAVLTALKRDDDAGRVAQKLREAVAAPLRIDAHDFVLTASVGVALFPKDGQDSATLLRNADAALYRAKEEGRDCLRFFTAEMNQRVVRYLEIEGAMRRALEAGEFRLHYQPIVALVTEKIAGFEALIRWKRADGALLPPAEFIPVAEDSGLIVPIGRWVLQTAAREVRRWNRRRSRPLYVSINLSARQFRDPRLLDTVRESLRGSGADPSHIRLEITESTVMSSAEDAIKTLRALRALGVRISVDDFGTGYSSLGYLKRFPINTLKIDRGFVRDLATDRDDLRISRAVIDLAHGLGLDVVAEGVETRRQARILAKYGCDAAQGYLFGRPAEEAHVEVARGRSSRRRAVRRAPGCH